MSKFGIKRIDIPGARVEFYSLVKDGKNLYEDFIKEVESKNHVTSGSKLHLKTQINPLDEMYALIEDIALGEEVLKNRYKPLPNISKQLNYSAFELKSGRKSMLRLYGIKERNTGKIIVLGHKKVDEKNQKKYLKKFVKICKEYHEYCQKHTIEIIQ